MGAIKGCSLLPLFDWEGNTFYVDVSCQGARRSTCPIHWLLWPT